MKYNRLNRRMFLQGAGKTLAIPFLASLLPRELWAQSTSTTIKRAIFLGNNYDYGRHQNWFPSMAQPSQMIPAANGDRAVYYQALNSYLTSSTSSLSTVFGNSLNPYLNSINLYRGLDQSTRIAHGRGHTLGNICAADGHDQDAQRLSPMRTIDWVLRDNARFNPINRDVVTIGHDVRSWRRNANGSISEANLIASTPQGVFNYLFDNGNYPESGAPTTPTTHPRRDLLTGVLEDYNRVRNGRQISAADRIALTNATDLIADIQRNLASTGGTTGGACRYKSISTTGNGEPYFENALTLKAFADIVCAGIMCDVSRVYHWAAWMNEGVIDMHPTEDFHQGHSHIPFTTVNGKVNWLYMGEIQNRFVRNFVQPLLAGLAGATDPANGQTYLYNSLVHYTIECGQVHGHNTQPCFTAGNAGGAISSGYLLDYTDRSRPHAWASDNFSNNPSDPRFSHEYVGVPLNRMFVTILQSMGLSPADYENASINQHFQGRSDGRYGAGNNGIASMGGYGHWGPAQSNYGQDYITRQASFNLHTFKNPLPLPSRSAA